MSVSPIHEPATRVAPAVTFKPGLRQGTVMVSEWLEAMRGPGMGLNLTTSKRYQDVRDRLEKPTSYLGIHLEKGGTPTVESVRNPDAPDGQWDPYQWMPRFVFEADEDAFPVSPTFDGDTDVNNNGPKTAGAAGAHYQDGVVGGRQPLSAGFSVTRKGGYTILTYSFYYAHNKAVHYHGNDYSTAQVYLKPGADGRLEPAYLATSWHYGSILTPWKDLGKDAQGRPIVQVHQGSHSLQPYGVGRKPPAKGLAIAGDGTATIDGKPTPHKLSFDVVQRHVKGANYVAPLSPEGRVRIDTMRWGDAGNDPLLPESFKEHSRPWPEMGTWLLKKAETGVKKAAGFVADKVMGFFGKLF